MRSLLLPDRPEKDIEEETRNLGLCEDAPGNLTWNLCISTFRTITEAVFRLELFCHGNPF